MPDKRENDLCLKWGDDKISRQEKGELITTLIGKSILCDEIANQIHYPECWDTAAYPSLLHAIREFGCNPENCKQITEKPKSFAERNECDTCGKLGANFDVNGLKFCDEQCTLKSETLHGIED